MKFLFFTALALLFSYAAFSKNYFVNPAGSDANSGLSTTAPLKTLQAAANKTVPGDTVFAMNGTYTNTTNGTNVINVVTSGTASKWIVYMNYPNHQPLIKLTKNWSGIQVQGADYIIIDGFTVVGNNDAITLAYAQSQKNNLNNPSTSGNGIGCAPQYNNPSNLPHHIVVRNCNVSKCGGGGIYTTKADYLTFVNNTVWECAWYAPYGNSGISLYQNWNSDGYTGVKNIIAGNTVYRNEEYIAFYYAGYISDGNGIIVDDGRNTQNNSTLGNYAGKTSITNNVVFNNGGRGIHVYSSDKVMIANNTCFNNCQSPAVQSGEFTAFEADSIWFVNNIAVPKQGIKPISTSTTTTSNLIVSYNIWGANAAAAQPFGSNTLSTAPLFVNATINAATADFRLLSSSVGVNDGTATFAPSFDKDGIVRPTGIAVDRGAYELSNLPAAAIVPAGPIGLCAGNFPITLSAATNAGDATFSWKKNDAVISPAQTGSTLSVSQSGSYSVIVTRNGFNTESAPVIVTVYPLKTTALDTTACGSLLWNGTTYTLSGIYSKSFLTQYGCDSVAVLHLRVSKPVASATKTDAQCYGSATGTISANASGGVAPYQYKLNSSGTYSTASSFSNLRAFSGYKVYVTDSAGCTGISSTIVISQQPAITAITSKTDVTCYGATTGSLTVTSVSNGVAPFMYRIGTGAYQSSPTFTGLKAMVHKVTILDATGCTSIVNVTIAQPPAITASLNMVAPTCYGTATGFITVSPQNGTPPYQYHLGSTTGTYSSSNVLTNVRGGTALIYIRDTTGCVNRVVASVPQPAAITIGFSQVNPTCFNSKGSITLFKTGGPNNPPYLYSLNTRPAYVSNNVFDTVKTGYHVGYIKDALGCTARTANILLPIATNCLMGKMDAVKARQNQSEDALKVTLLNNPTATQFVLQISSQQAAPVSLSVTSVTGVRLYNKTIAANKTVSFGNEWKSGIYIIAVSQFNQCRVLKGIKK